MFVDADAVENDAAFAADVCVVGAGAAGITLARALAGAGLEVVLAESGGFESDPRTESLYEGVSVGREYPLARSRLRYFGGSTNHWGGMSQRLGAADFMVRPWIPHSGWPLARADLDPWYEKALPVLDIPRLYDRADVEEKLAAYPWLLDAGNPAFETLLWATSPPTRMGPKYRAELAASARIRCVLHANVLAVVPTPDARAVHHLDAATLGGRRLVFTARHYVLATGGIENARLLLLSDGVVPGGLGNQHDLVGRFFADHLNYLAGDMLIAPPPGALGFQEEWVKRRKPPGLHYFIGFATTAAARARHRLLGFTLNCVFAGVESLPVETDDAARAVDALVRAPGEPPGRPAARTRRLIAIAEQSPNPQSRISLGLERDRLGQRQVVVDLQLDDADGRSIRKSVELFAVELAKAGRGRVKAADVREPRWFSGGGHHIGTTRMADDPRRGVTDGHGTVHGIANLHVAGSSLFPTAGNVNPTFTVVALALRQAERLATLAARPAPAVGQDGAR